MKKKTICFIILVIILLFTSLNNVYGAETNAKDVGNNLGIGNLDDYKGGNIGNTSKVTDKVGEVLGYIRVIGMIVSVGVLMVLGIKYMAGSVEEKASYKHSMIPYLIGAAILFSGTLLPSMIYDISHNLG